MSVRGWSDQLDEPDHRNADIVLPNQERHAQSHDEHGPTEPVQRHQVDPGGEAASAPDSCKGHVHDWNQHVAKDNEGLVAGGVSQQQFFLVMAGALDRRMAELPHDESGQPQHIAVVRSEKILT